MISNKGIQFLLVWLINSLLIFLANYTFPEGYELGNVYLSLVLAGVISGLFLTVWGRIVKPFVKWLKLEPKGRYAMFGFYWLANSAGIWLIARIAAVSGFGIARYHWAIGLGFVTCLGQWAVRQLFKSKKRK